jgi:hypothetical protein
MKIFITILVLILLGIVVGSNLLPTMTIVILNQPTIALPIGIWLSVAIGAGFLSSISIQFLLSLDRRLLKRQIRQLQSRLSPPDADVFTYMPSTPEPDLPAPDRATDSPNPRKNLFNSYRAGFSDRFSKPQTSEPQIADRDDDDWDERPRSNRQLDWDDSIPSQSPNVRSPGNRPPIETDRVYEDRHSSTIDRESEQNSRQVYDADFRLIQPPYKEPLATEFADDRDDLDFEYAQIDEDEDIDLPQSSVKPTVSDRSYPSRNLDDEDWGFDFDNDDAPVKAK